MLGAAVAFGRLLRRAGLQAGPDRVVEFARALEELDASRREDVYWAGRVTLCSRREDLDLYDLVFRIFWEGQRKARSAARPKARLTVDYPNRSSRQNGPRRPTRWARKLSYSATVLWRCCGTRTSPSTTLRSSPSYTGSWPTCTSPGRYTGPGG